MQPEWLDLKNQCKKFSFHGLVLKYIRIYSPKFESKGIKFSVMGKSYEEILANPKAVSIIPHTFLDNAAKYSPKGGKVEIYIQDSEEGIDFSIASYGPKITSKEKNKIFQAFYRGEHAIKIEEEGAGFGLYLCQLVAVRHLGTQIFCEQDKEEIKKMGYWTTFSIRIPRISIIIKE